MAPISTQPEAELDVADSLSVATFVPQGVAGPFGDRLTLPLADGAHDGDDQAPRGRAGVYSCIRTPLKVDVSDHDVREILHRADPDVRLMRRHSKGTLPAINECGPHPGRLGADAIESMVRHEENLVHTHA